MPGYPGTTTVQVGAIRLAVTSPPGRCGRELPVREPAGRVAAASVCAGEDLHAHRRRRHHRAALRRSGAEGLGPAVGLRHRRRGAGRARGGPGPHRARRRARRHPRRPVPRPLRAMAELATLPENRHKLTAGTTLVTPEMVDRARGAHRRGQRALRRRPPSSSSPVRRRSPPSSTWPAPWCAGPSGWPSPLAAEGSSVVAYLNRLSDLCWTLARWAEGEDGPLLSRSVTPPR